MSRKPIPLQQVLQAFHPEELEMLYPGITAPQGFLRYAKADPATGQFFIEAPQAVRAIEQGAKQAKQGAGAQAKKEKLSKEELLGAFQAMIQKAAPVVNQGAGVPIVPQVTAEIGPASVARTPAFPGVQEVFRGGIGPTQVHRNVKVALDE